MKVTRRISFFLSMAVALVLAAPTAALSTEEGPRKDREAAEAKIEMLSVSLLDPPAKGSITKATVLRLGRQATRTPNKMRPTGARRDDPGHGYVLVGNNKYSDYGYKSDPRYNSLFKCKDGVCHNISTVKVWFRQRVEGGSSRFWTIRFYKKRHSGTIETNTWYRINCYVNIKRKRDKSCTSWRDDNSWGPQRDQYFRSGHAADDQRLRFGNTNGVRKYPIVRLSTDWWGYPGAKPTHGKFRGWDTITSSRNSKLSPATGTGH